MFANLKNSRMFAPSFAKRCFLSVKVLAFFYANTATAISINDTGYQIPVVCYSFIDSECLLAKKGGDSLFYIHLDKIHSHMPKDNEFVSPAKVSSRENTPSGATTVSMRSKKLHRNEIIQQLKIQITELQRELLRLEGDEDIIGAKVVYNEKYLKRTKNNPCYPLPECGYFIIEQARLRDDGRVMVRLNIGNKYTFADGTHICLGNLKMYNPENQ